MKRVRLGLNLDISKDNINQEVASAVAEAGKGIKPIKVELQAASPILKTQSIRLDAESTLSQLSKTTISINADSSRKAASELAGTLSDTIKKSVKDAQGGGLLNLVGSIITAPLRLAGALSANVFRGAGEAIGFGVARELRTTLKKELDFDIYRSGVGNFIAEIAAAPANAFIRGNEQLGAVFVKIRNDLQSNLKQAAYSFGDALSDAIDSDGNKLASFANSLTKDLSAEKLKSDFKQAATYSKEIAAEIRDALASGARFQRIFDPLGESLAQFRETALKERALPLVLQRAQEISESGKKTAKAGTYFDKERGKERDLFVKTGNVVDEQTKELIIAVGGYAKAQGRSGLRIPGLLGDLPEGTKAIGALNRDTDINATNSNVDKIFELVGSLAKPNLRGFNKDAVEIAAQAIAALQKNPEIRIKILGESGGGYPAEEAKKILDLLGYGDRSEYLAVGTPDFQGRLDRSGDRKILSSDEMLGAETARLYRPLGLASDAASQKLVGAKGHPIENYLEFAELQNFVYGLPPLFTDNELAQAKEAASQFKNIQREGKSNRDLDKLSAQAFTTLQTVRRQFDLAEGALLNDLQEIAQSLESSFARFSEEPETFGRTRQILARASTVLAELQQKPGLEAQRVALIATKELQQLQGEFGGLEERKSTGIVGKKYQDLAAEIEQTIDAFSLDRLIAQAKQAKQQAQKQARKVRIIDPNEGLKPWDKAYDLWAEAVEVVEESEEQATKVFKDIRGKQLGLDLGDVGASPAQQTAKEIMDLVVSMVRTMDVQSVGTLNIKGVAQAAKASEPSEPTFKPKQLSFDFDSVSAGLTEQVYAVETELIRDKQALEKIFDLVGLGDSFRSITTSASNTAESIQKVERDFLAIVPLGREAKAELQTMLSKLGMLAKYSAVQGAAGAAGGVLGAVQGVENAAFTALPFLKPAKKFVQGVGAPLALTAAATQIPGAGAALGGAIELAGTAGAGGAGAIATAIIDLIGQGVLAHLPPQLVRAVLTELPSIIPGLGGQSIAALAGGSASAVGGAVASGVGTVAAETITALAAGNVIIQAAKGSVELLPDAVKRPALAARELLALPVAQESQSAAARGTQRALEATGRTTKAIAESPQVRARLRPAQSAEAEVVSNAQRLPEATKPIALPAGQTFDAAIERSKYLEEQFRRLQQALYKVTQQMKADPGNLDLLQTATIQAAQLTKQADGAQNELRELREILKSTGAIDSGQSKQLTGYVGAIGQRAAEGRKFLAQLAQQYESSGRDIGRFISAGISAGMDPQEARKAAEAIVRTLVETTESKLGIESPSKVFRQIGRFIAQGLGLGVKDETKNVEKTVLKLVGPSYVNRRLEAIAKERQIIQSAEDGLIENIRRLKNLGEEERASQLFQKPVQRKPIKTVQQKLDNAAVEGQAKTPVFQASTVAKDPIQQIFEEQKLEQESFENRLINLRQLGQKEQDAHNQKIANAARQKKIEQEAFLEKIRYEKELGEAERSRIERKATLTSKEDRDAIDRTLSNAAKEQQKNDLSVRLLNLAPKDDLSDRLAQIKKEEQVRNDAANEQIALAKKLREEEKLIVACKVEPKSRLPVENELGSKISVGSEQIDQYRARQAAIRQEAKVAEEAIKQSTKKLEIEGFSVGKVFKHIAFRANEAKNSLIELAVKAGLPIGALSKVGGLLKGVGIAALGFVTISSFGDAIVQAGRAAFDTALQMERIKAQLEFINGGGTAGVAGAARDLEFLNKVAKDTKQPVSGLADGYAQLKQAVKGTALEGKALDEIYTSLAVNARVNGADTEKLRGQQLQLQQVFRKGRADTEDLNTLSENRLTLQRKLQEVTGTSGAEFTKLLESGGITADKVAKAIKLVGDEALPGLARANETASAKIGEFQYRLEQLNNAVGPAILGSFGAVLSGVITGIGVLEDAGRRLEPVFGVIKEAGGIIVDIASPIVGAVGAIASAVSKDLLDGFAVPFQAIRAGLVELRAGIQDAFGTIGAVLTPIGKALKILPEGINPATVAMKALGAAIAFIALTQLATVIGGITVALKGLAIANYTAVLPSLIAVRGAALAFIATPLGATLTAIGVAAVVAAANFDGLARSVIGYSKAQQESDERGIALNKEYTDALNKLGKGIPLTADELKNLKTNFAQSAKEGRDSAGDVKVLTANLDRLQSSALAAAEIQGKLTAAMNASKKAIKEVSKEIDADYATQDAALNESLANQQITRERFDAEELNAQQEKTKQYEELYDKQSGNLQAALLEAQTRLAAPIPAEARTAVLKQVEELEDQLNDIEKSRGQARIEYLKGVQKQNEKIESDRVKRSENTQKAIQTLADAGVKTQGAAEQEVSALKEAELQRRIKALNTQISAERNAAGQLTDIGKNLHSEKIALEAELQKSIADRTGLRSKSEAELVEVEEKAQKTIQALVQSGVETEQEAENRISQIKQEQIKRRIGLVNEELKSATSKDAYAKILLNRKELEAELSQVVAEGVNKRYELLLKDVQREQESLAAVLSEVETRASTDIQRLQNRGVLKQRAVDMERLNITKFRLQQELQAQKQYIAELQKLPDPTDPEKRREAENTLRDAKLKTAQITQQLAEQEYQQQEKIREIAIDAIDERIKGQENLGKEAEEFAGVATRALENQNKLLEAQKSLKQSMASYDDQAYKILIDTEKSETEKAKLQELAAIARLRGLKETQAIERDILELQIEQERVANRIATVKAAAALERAKAEEEKVALDPEATGVDKRAANLTTQSAGLELGALLQAGQLQDRLAQSRRAQSKIDDNRETLAARFELANARTDKSQKDEEIEKLREEARRGIGMNRARRTIDGALPQVDLHSGAIANIQKLGDISGEFKQLRELTSSGVVGNLTQLVNLQKNLSVQLNTLAAQPRVTQNITNNPPTRSRVLAGSKG